DALTPQACSRFVAIATKAIPHSTAVRDRTRPLLAAALEVLGLDVPAAELEMLLTAWLAPGAGQRPDWSDASGLGHAAAAACCFGVEPGGAEGAGRIDTRGRGPLPAGLDRNALLRGLQTVAGRLPGGDAAPASLVAAFRDALAINGIGADRLILTVL